MQKRPGPGGTGRVEWNGSGRTQTRPLGNLRGGLPAATFPLESLLSVTIPSLQRGGAAWRNRPLDSTLLFPGRGGKGAGRALRSEERRVGNEGRSRWSTYAQK